MRCETCLYGPDCAALGRFRFGGGGRPADVGERRGVDRTSAAGRSAVAVERLLEGAAGLRREQEDRALFLDPSRCRLPGIPAAHLVARTRCATELHRVRLADLRLGIVARGTALDRYGGAVGGPDRSRAVAGDRP